MKTLGWVTFALVAFVFTAGPAFAAGGAASMGLWAQTAAFTGSAIAAGLGAGLTIIGAGIGFGKIGSSALESMARQPETADKVQTAMLIIAALLEGATFFSLIVCIIMGLKAAP